MPLKPNKLTIDWDGALCCGLTLDWHFNDGCVDVSMPGCVPRALKWFEHPPPRQPQHAPYKWWLAQGSGSGKPQTATIESQATPLAPDGTTHTQQFRGTFLHCSNNDCCILPALNEISSQQSAPTTDTNDSSNWPMDCPRTHPNAIIRFHASDMILKTTVDAACLVSRSRAAAHCHLGWQNDDRVNGAIDVPCKTIKNVVSSASEEPGHKQPATGSPLETDNRTARGILQFQDATKALQILRHALLVDEGSHPPGPIQCPLGPRKIQFG
jgi:hypothetical protein